MIGDYSSTDAAGREIQNILIEEFLFSFWVDEAARQVRITEVVEA